MVLDERSRHQLYLRLEETLGAEAASTLMEHLPPVGWADVATKRDIDQLRSEIRSDLRAEINGLRAEFHKESKTITLAVMGVNSASVLAAVVGFVMLR